ncbi:MAG TPA: hypothetical protein VFQ43_03715, partial [Nitrososphaera sp.]|nr:hypothetical protein [Nitrososphaera sp.]
KIEKAATRYQKITNPSELKKQGIKKFISQESLKSLPLLVGDPFRTGRWWTRVPGVSAAPAIIVFEVVQY